ncbi:tetratricopeptide repeat protein [Marinobacter orientalis]|uniref:Sel1 repeat family protein n=1 Tax=Marinobacter orientalis TaxID=1928859 RepID=A0A7Y0RDM6_9GAMM|nr:SEL1-like repeat protein [Marinobacter orientalis]NMT64297.1 sel1 repeat family protein [Marinobacter orientalis]TGX49511.1 sel1 repeat family protein [Marinobacter orientalis]
MPRRYAARWIAMAVSLPILLSPVAQGDESDQQLGVAREMVKVLEAYAVYKMGQYDLAFERYQALAESGSHQGMYNLANMYAAGQGVTQSDVRAFEWYLKAAEAGNRLSMAEVARAYAEGAGTEASPVQAHHWQAMAAEEP